MIFLRFLSVFLLVLGFSVSAELDVAAIKKSVAANIEALAKNAGEDIHKMADDFRIREVQSSILLKEYARDKHEAFRAEEERHLADRVANNVQHLTADLDSMVEKAFVDILKRQNTFEEAVKKDIALFKQQFSENIIKVLQGKNPTPITYSSGDSVAKPSADGSSRMPENTLILPEQKRSTGSNSVSNQGVKSNKKIDLYQPVDVGPDLMNETKPLIAPRKMPAKMPQQISGQGKLAQPTSDQENILKQIRG